MEDTEKKTEEQTEKPIKDCGRKRPYDAVIFDLDGTLLDTLADLAGSVNAAMRQFGLPERTLDEVRMFVGNGIRKLIQRAVPGGESHPEFERILDFFREHYGVHCMDETEAYPGILSLLDWLKRMDIHAAIVSNKADFAVKKLRDVYFKELVEVAIGEREGVRKKPEPDSVLQALTELGVECGRAVYVGDSDVDLQTAGNAGLDCILVSWGFRSRDFLLAAGAVPGQIVASVRDLKSLLEG